MLASSRPSALRRIPIVVSVLGLLAVAALGHLATPATAQEPPPAGNAEVPLPAPEPGSFFTIFDYLSDGRLIAFDGFTVYVQQNPSSDTLNPIGTLPEQDRGATDPAFVAVSPSDQTILLGGGAGGSRFPDPEFNGNIFKMPITGGTAQLVGRYPFHILGFFINEHQFIFGQGETFGFFTGSIELLDVNTGQTRPLIGDIPGDPGGVAYDRVDPDLRGNLYVGLGSGQDPGRTGEIRRFEREDVRRALRGEVVLDFDDDSTLIADVLNAGDFDFASRHRLFVGGGDFGNPDQIGYVAEVNTNIGQVVNRFDPVDGDPNDGDSRFFEIAFASSLCILGAQDLNAFFNSDPEVVYQRTVCTP
jgi:hypothetical protein